MSEDEESDFLEFRGDEDIDENTITFQIDDEEGNVKEVIKVTDQGFFIYGERLKSADDVAAAFRHYFSQVGYDLDSDGRIIAEEFIDLELNSGEGIDDDE